MLKFVQHAGFPYKKMKAVITCLVISAKMNFVGYVWTIGRSIQDQTISVIKYIYIY